MPQNTNNTNKYKKFRKSLESHDEHNLSFCISHYECENLKSLGVDFLNWQRLFFSVFFYPSNIDYSFSISWLSSLLWRRTLENIFVICKTSINLDQKTRFHCLRVIKWWPESTVIIFIYHCAILFAKPIM